MNKNAVPTRDRIISAAEKLFYSEGIGRVSVDAVAARAGVTKRTLYYHFASKDDLIAAYLAARDQPNLALFRRWYTDAEGSAAEKTKAIFSALAGSARHPKWKGCGFLRTSAELASMPGHPALRIGAAHKKKFEDWMRLEFETAGIRAADLLARQVLLLMDGAFAATLLQGDPLYIEAAGEAAETLVSVNAQASRRMQAANKTSQ